MSTQTLAIELSLFLSRIEAVCEEMGAVLQRAAFSTNIKDRLDYSCAVFDRNGKLCAQAAHIPVHLGSMAFAMADLVNSREWREGDMLIVNDPYLGGTHLPDVTLIASLFDQGECVGFVANRAHHADIGSESPGSMPVSKSLQEEGLIIPPTLLMQDHALLEHEFERLLQSISSKTQARGDFTAQISANRVGLQRLTALLAHMGRARYLAGLQQLNDYAERMAHSALLAIPDGDYGYVDYMDDDGQGNINLAIQVRIHVKQGKIAVDFSGSSSQVKGNINCPLSVAAAAVYYVFRCLMPAHTPNCDGALRDIQITAPRGSLVNAERPAAVAAGNVETSTRIVDVLMGALAKALPGKIPAASQGSMNNLAMGRGGKESAGKESAGKESAGKETGNSPWSYYETVAGGRGGGPLYPGQSAVQSHMTNTRNTPVEVLEMNYPLRITEYAIRKQSGGQGLHQGGDGVIRRYQFLAPARLSILSERRRRGPWGLNGGEAGLAGENRLNDQLLPAKTEKEVATGDVLSILTPGGGGWGISTR